MRIFTLVIFYLIGIGLSAQDISVYLVGDAGEPIFPADKNLEFLKSQFSSATENDVLVFLGDNVYPEGIPSKEDDKRSDYENKLKPTLDLMKAFPGRSIIIPGNHDWKKGKKDGWRQIQNMQNFVDEYVGDQVSFLPRDACPGPLEIELNAGVILIILDTQYLLHPWEKPDGETGCESKSTTDAIYELEQVISRNKDKHVMVIGHHPMYSYGPHGGKYTLKQHLFPLTDVKKKLYIPLPVLGSIYPGFRTLIGSRQDIKHPRYRLVRNAITQAMGASENVVYANGHEHSLQYIQKGTHHYVTSGSGSKSSHVVKGKHAEFAQSVRGFAKVSYTESGDASLAFFDGDQGKKIDERTLYSKQIKQTIISPEKIDFSDSTVTVPISTKYSGASSRKQFWLGVNYRELWETPVEIPVFDIGAEHGGLKVLKMGGGFQTRSLRMEAEDGRQYVLRSLDKYTDKLIPLELQKSLAADVLQDQISGANPYGAFAVPTLAEAAGIYHTNPTMVFIPDDPRFGPYRELLKGTVALYEERPNDEAAVEPHFGSGDDVKGTDDMLNKIWGDNDEVVDQPFSLRTRLLDMVLADWDRHDDQWRWVAVGKEEGKGHIWRPIPRDRDQAFFASDGFLAKVASRKWALPNFEGFHEEIKYPPGFNTSGRYFDRTFINGLDWSQWQEQITILQSKLTDQELDKAFDTWPDEIQNKAKAKTVEILKARRDDMNRFARIHYLFLSKEVEVVGSDKNELFEVERLDDERTKVTVRKISKKGKTEQILYQRTFLLSETKEIRLYGLDGKDEFKLSGETKKGIKVRIIGGEGKDKISDESIVSGISNKTLVYDRKKNTKLERSSTTKSKLSDDPAVNIYNRKEFEYDKLIPLVSVEFNPDDGLFLGGGFQFTKKAWRRDPFAYRHSLKGNVALETGAFHLYYKGTITDVVGKWDLGADLSFQRPFGVSNYFGIGNESVFDYKGENVTAGYDDEIDFYRVQYEQSRNYVFLSKQLGQKGSFKIGPEFYRFDLEKRDRGFLNTEIGQTQPEIYQDFNFLGYRSDIEVDTKNHPGMPSHGINAKLSYENLFSASSLAKDIHRVSAEFSFLLSTKIPSKLTLANRVGTVYNFNDVQFFNGATLGRATLRGYRRTRFVGDASFYHNVDLRLKLFTIRTYLLPIGTGIIGFHDVGRVWLDGETSSKWHSSKGFGIWISPLDQIAITFNMAFTDEENIPTVAFGYHF
ncbi:MAG: metallophosphoesterase [Cyclobacteriaceae bacterium]